VNFVNPNPSKVILQVQAQNPDGAPKLSLLSAAVRVYHLDGAAEVEDLTSVPLAQVGSSNTWRYIWSPGSLPAGNYFAEYDLTDTDGIQFVGVENVDVFDVAKQVDLNLIKQIESGRWRIANNQMTFYDTDGNTILTFNLLDQSGTPTMGQVYERTPA